MKTGNQDLHRTRAAFTLLEVLLAVSIAAGMLAVVLYFHTQAANLRVHLFQETARVSAVRLLLDRLTTELGSVRRCDSLQAGLKGGSDSIEFVRLDVPSLSGWTNSADPAIVNPTTPFRLIRYGVLHSADTTNVTGFTRSEEPLLRPATVPVEEDDVAATNTVVVRSNPVSIDQIRFLQFRYWNGAAWLDSWTALELPFGVEVNLGAEPLPEETLPEEYPYELFRRVIYLPGHSPAALTNEMDDPFLEEVP